MEHSSENVPENVPGMMVLKMVILEKKVYQTKCNGNLEPTWPRALLVGAATGPGR